MLLRVSKDERNYVLSKHNSNDSTQADKAVNLVQLTIHSAIVSFGDYFYKAIQRENENIYNKTRGSERNKNYGEEIKQWWALGVKTSNGIKGLKSNESMQRVSPY